ncbi:MAG: DUF4810 domain-containing protein [Spongiibacter sp.]
MKKIVLVATLAIVCTACATQNEMYYWGDYEELIYDMYIKPGEAPPDLQIQKLTEDIQRAQDNGKRVPPGLYGHLGYMYTIVGNLPQAATAFSQEKALYPESAVLIDGFLARMQQGAQR